MYRNPNSKSYLVSTLTSSSSSSPPSFDRYDNFRISINNNDYISKNNNHHHHNHIDNTNIKQQPRLTITTTNATNNVTSIAAATAATASTSTTTTGTTSPTRSDNTQAIYYYRGDSVNRSSIIISDEFVSPLDLTLIIFVLLLWVATILMCVNKWGKIRMLEPYQPSFQASGEDEFHSTSTVNKKPLPGGIVRQSSAPVGKISLNRSTIRVIPSESDLVNLPDSYLIGMGRSCDIGLAGLRRGVRDGYTVIHGSGSSGSGGAIYPGTMSGNSLISGSRDKVKESKNIPRIEISPINWSEERKCKSLDDVRVRLLAQ